MHPATAAQSAATAITILHLNAEAVMARSLL
jgi:hypothetical protein